jgi:hypothetical protein
LLFGGFDSDENFGLWASNCPAAGAFEIGGLRDAGISGAASTGLDPFNKVALGSEVLFRAADSAGHFGTT